MHSVNRRCKYYCDVEDAEGTPSFTIRVDDEGHKEQLVFRGKSPRGIYCKGRKSTASCRTLMSLANRAKRVKTVLRKLSCFENRFSEL